MSSRKFEQRFSWNGFEIGLRSETVMALSWRWLRFNLRPECGTRFHAGYSSLRLALGWSLCPVVVTFLVDDGDRGGSVLLRPGSFSADRGEAPGGGWDGFG